MSIILRGVTSGADADVESDSKALRAALLPTNREGDYFLGGATGIVVTPAALAEIFQLRNPSATTLLIIERLVISMANAAAVTAAQEFGWDAIRSTAFSVDGTGGTALLGNKRRSSHPASVVVSGNARIATTAALGAGTKTLDTGGPFASGPGPNTNAIGQVSQAVEVENPVGRGPILVLAQNEGISIRNLVAYVTGSARFHVLVLWREVLTAEWPAV